MFLKSSPPKQENRIVPLTLHSSWLSMPGGRSFYDSFLPKAKAPPIFVSGGGRSESALALDRKLRSYEAIGQVMALVSSELEHFDAGNVVIALNAAARVVDERTGTWNGLTHSRR